MVMDWSTRRVWRAGFNEPHADTQRLPTPAVFLGVPWHLNVQSLCGHLEESGLGIDLRDVPQGVLLLALGGDGGQSLSQVLIVQFGQFSLEERLGGEKLLVEFVFCLFEGYPHSRVFGRCHLNGQVGDATLGVRPHLNLIGSFADEVGAAYPGDGHAQACTLGLGRDLFGNEVHHVRQIFLDLFGICAHAREQAQRGVAGRGNFVLYLRVDPGLFEDALQAGREQFALASRGHHVRKWVRRLLTRQGHD